MDERRIRAELDNCLVTDDELATLNWKDGYDDWPAQRAYTLE